VRLVVNRGPAACHRVNGAAANWRLEDFELSFSEERTLSSWRELKGGSSQMGSPDSFLIRYCRNS
jgi:hypothetical protein